jgi:hypothetical protein
MLTEPSAGAARRWLGNWRADAAIMARSSVVQATILVWLLWYGYTTSLAIRLADVPPSDGYYLHQAWLDTALNGRLGMIVVCAYLGASDQAWRTLAQRQLVGGRSRLAATRLTGIALVSGLLVVVFALPGVYLDLTLGTPTPDPLAAVAQGVAACGLLTLGAVIAYLVASGARSFAAGSAGIIAWALLEEILERYLPLGLIRLLPGWNSHVVLEQLFPIADSVTLTPLFHPGPLLSSAIVCGLYLLAGVGAAWLHSWRRTV